MRKHGAPLFLSPCWQTCAHPGDKSTGSRDYGGTDTAEKHWSVDHGDTSVQRPHLWGSSFTVSCRDASEKGRCLPRPPLFSTSALAKTGRLRG